MLGVRSQMCTTLSCFLGPRFWDSKTSKPQSMAFVITTGRTSVSTKRLTRWGHSSAYWSTHRPSALLEVRTRWEKIVWHKVGRLFGSSFGLLALCGAGDGGSSYRRFHKWLLLFLWALMSPDGIATFLSITTLLVEPPGLCDS